MGAVNVELDVLIEKVTNWHTQRYPELLSNSPSEQSFASIRLLCEKILLPVQIEFGQVNVTYGFTSASLVNLIRKKCPAGTAPKLDQHAAHECNSYGPENSKFVQLMGESKKGRRIPKQRASYKSFNSLLKQ